jgi:uncharacterized protein (TIGR02118 family)
MIKLVFAIRRREGISEAEFRRYWREDHAALVTRHAEALRIRRYVQTHTVEQKLGERLADARGSISGRYDGLAELWWDSLQDMIEASTSIAGERASRELVADEQRFIDLSASAIWMGEENPVITGLLRARPCR